MLNSLHLSSIHIGYMSLEGSKPGLFNLGVSKFSEGLGPSEIYEMKKTNTYQSHKYHNQYKIESWANADPCILSVSDHFKLPKASNLH